MPNTSQAETAAVDAMLALAAERGWNNVSLADIAARTGLSVGALHQAFGGKDGLMAALWAQLDDAMPDGDDDAGSSTRDRLFDVLMRRFDAMQAHRAAIRSMIADSMGDPVTWARSARHSMRTGALMLESAGISATGPFGRLKAKGMTALYLFVLRTWMRDDSPDMTDTMAAVDKSLRRAEKLVSYLRIDQHLSDKRRSDKPADDEATTKA